jgi:hypothetical protein
MSSFDKKESHAVEDISDDPAHGKVAVNIE